MGIEQFKKMLEESLDTEPSEKSPSSLKQGKPKNKEEIMKLIAQILGGKEDAAKLNEMRLMASYMRASYKACDAAILLNGSTETAHETLAKMMAKDDKVKAAAALAFQVGMSAGLREAAHAANGDLQAEALCKILDTCLGKSATLTTTLIPMFFDITNNSETYPTFRPIQKQLEELGEWEHPFQKDKLASGENDD